MPAARRRGPRAVPAVLLALVLVLAAFPIPDALPRPSPRAAGRPRPRLPSGEVLGAFFQVYRNVKASFFALQHFRQHYPLATVIMVNDGGDSELATVARRFGAHYTLADHTPSGRRQSFRGLPASALQWLSRLLNASCLVPEPFLLLLEDDVFIVNKTHAEHLRFDVNGVEAGIEVFNGATSDYLRSQQPLLAGRALPLAGFGGSIFRSSFLCGMWREFDRVEADVGSFFGLIESDGSVAAPDVIISFLTYMRGGTTGNFPGRTETWHTDYAARMARRDVELVHDYKALYR